MDLSDNLLLGVTVVLVLGVAAQWLSWRLKLPAILLLLITGFIAGPLSSLWLGEPWLVPDALMGQGLFPFISAAVAIILFEGGLSLRITDLRHIGRVVGTLLAVGVLGTWALATLAAWWLLGWDFWLSLLMGAILVVTGPTVIGPLLRQVRPRGQVGPLLRWEGILNDPVGAVLAVLVFELILARAAPGAGPGMAGAIAHVGVALGAGLLVGAAGAGALLLPLWRYWIPDYLQSAVTLVVVLAVFMGSNALAPESGLAAVTFMGMVLANQRLVTVRHIIEFKENLRVLLLSALFILLAARLNLESLSHLGWGSLVFLAVVVFAIRPVVVQVATLGSGMDWRERLYVSLIAPRGIVAAAISSIFAIRLESQGYPDAAELVPVTFLIIVGTIAFSGLIAGPLARWLNLAATDPQGTLFMGAHPWAREIAATLQAQGFPVLMVDTNHHNVREAGLAGLRCIQGSLLSEAVLHRLDLSNTRRFLALTPNDEANSLAAVRMIETLGRKEIYQIPPLKTSPERSPDTPSRDLRGRYLFGPTMNFYELDRRFRRGAALKVTRLTSAFDFEAFREHYGNAALPMFIITEARRLRVMTAEDPPRPTPGQQLISLIEPEAQDVTHQTYATAHQRK